MKKKVIAALLTSAMAVSLLAGCGTTVESTGSSQSTSTTETKETAAPAETETAAVETEVAEEDNTDLSANITLWTYPIGKWGDSATVDSLITSFNAKYPNINVTVEYLDYTNGDDQVNTAIEGGQAPDLVMEGPERLVANWGAKGLMVDLSDIMDD